MRSLAKEKLGKRLPNLKRVIWWYQPYQQHHGDTSGNPLFGSLLTLQQLRKTYLQVGIELEWCSTRFFVDTPFGRQLEG